MPQKVNPDTLELTRGKTARVLGNLQTLLVLVKGLPLAYNRDLQEDKPPLFDSFETVGACLELAIPIVEQSELRRESIASRLDQGYLDATTLMEALMKQGIPQRTAHHLVGALVGTAQKQNKRLADLTDAEFKAAHPSISSTIREVLGVEKSGASLPKLRVEQSRLKLVHRLRGGASNYNISLVQAQSLGSVSEHNQARTPMIMKPVPFKRTLKIVLTLACALGFRPLLRRIRSAAIVRLELQPTPATMHSPRQVRKSQRPCRGCGPSRRSRSSNSNAAQPPAQNT